jgi:hypothetical protein
VTERDLPPDAHIDPNAWAEVQRKNYTTSNKWWWSREYGYLCCLDPFTGEVYEVAYADAPKWAVRRAFDEKERRRGQTHRR